MSAAASTWPSPRRPARRALALFCLLKLAVLLVLLILLPLLLPLLLRWLLR